MTHVRYIDKTREYYLGQGYEKPYEWAHNDDVPFTPLSKPLDECTVALVSTSDIGVRSDGDEADEATHELLVGNVYSLPSNTPLDMLFTRQEHYDKYATTLDDTNSFYPISRLHELVDRGRLGSVAGRAHGVYTAYSHRKTSEVDGPEVLRRCIEDEVDVVILTPV